MSLVSLGCRSDDWLWETLVLAHTLWQFHTTDLATALLVFSPCATCKDRADDHLYTETLALQSYGHHRVGRSQLPVRTNVCCCIQELGCNLVEHLSLERNAFRQHNVECRDSVSGDHHEDIVVNVIHITYFSVVNTLLSIKKEICLC